MLQVHVFLSLIGIASGFVVLYGLVTGRPFGGGTLLFLATTILTSITGFFYRRSALIRRALLG